MSRERWESVKSLRSCARSIYVRFALLFNSSYPVDLEKMIGEIGDDFATITDLHEENMHLLKHERFVLKTPVGNFPVRTLCEGACTLSYHCKTFGKVLLESIEENSHNRNFSITQAYFGALAEGAVDETNSALLKLDCPKEPQPDRKVYFPTLFVSRHQLVNRGRTRGLLNVSTGRLTQLIQNEGFPACHMKDGKQEYFLIDAINDWLKSRGKDEI